MKRITIASLVVLGMASCSPPNMPYIEYTTKITFCDQRPPDTIILDYPVSNNHISTYKRAVPEWGDYLNVCDLSIIQIDTLK